LFGGSSCQEGSFEPLLVLDYVKEPQSRSNRFLGVLYRVYVSSAEKGITVASIAGIFRANEISS
jgi:hypothetical protein